MTMLIYHHKERRRKRSFSGCIRNRCQQQRCITYTSSFFMQLFILTIIMAKTLDRSVAMDILNDHSTSDNVDENVLLAAINPHRHQIVLNEKLPPQKVNHRDYGSMTMPLASKSYGLMAEHTANRDQSKLVRENIIASLCNCSNGKSTKFHMSNCMQICDRQQQQHRQPHSNKFKRKRKQSINQKKFAQEHEHLTLIYGIDAISNSTQSKQRIVPNQSSEMTAVKFKRKSPTFYHRQHYTNLDAVTIRIDEKSLNNSNAHETNKPNHNQIKASTNLQQMTFYSDKQLGNFQNIDIKNNRLPYIDDATDEFNVVNNNKIVQSSVGKNVERKTRSIENDGKDGYSESEETRTKILPTQIDAMNANALNWQKAMLSRTKDSSSIKSTVNGIFDSSKIEDGIAEIIGTSNAGTAGATVAAATAAMNATRINDSTVSSKFSWIFFLNF